MFLSIIPRLERDAYRTHVYIYSYFDIPQTADRPFVFRETDDYLIVVSRIPPKCKHVDIKSRIKMGDTQAFSLICSPQRSHSAKVDGKRVTKRRVPYKTATEVSDWLDRRLDGAATVAYRRVDPIKPLLVKAGKKHYGMDRSIIRGSLSVDDRSKFIDLVTNGVGPKGWLGCGLLLMPDIMRDALELTNAAA